MPLQPLHQAVGRGVGDLAAQTLPLLNLHQLQDAPQVLQKVKRPQAAHEGGGGRLAIKQPIGVVQSLGACGGSEVESKEMYKGNTTHLHKLIRVYSLKLQLLIPPGEIVTDFNLDYS